MATSKTKTFNNLFGYLANKQVSVKRTNKQERYLGSDTIQNWTNTYEVTLPARASFEHNLLMAGKFAHPVLQNFTHVGKVFTNRYGWTYDEKRMNDDETVPVNSSFASVLYGALSAFEYARAAKVASRHYLNNQIFEASLKSLVSEYKEYSNKQGLTASSYKPDGLASFQIDLAAKLLGSKPVANSNVDLSFVTQLSDKDCADENLLPTFTRFVSELSKLFKAGLSKTPKQPKQEKGGNQKQEEGDNQKTDTTLDPVNQDGSKSPTPSDTKADEVKSKPIDNELQSAIRRDVIRSEVEFEHSKAKAKPAEVTEEIDEYSESRHLERVFEDIKHKNVNRLRESSWVPAYDVSGIIPPEFNEGSAFKTTGYVTPDAWKMSLGKTNVFNSNVDEGEPEIVVLVDCSSSTRESLKKNPFGFSNIAEAVWSLSAQLLKLSPNAKSYGYRGSSWGVFLTEGQPSGMIPPFSKDLASGGTPTSIAMSWATETLNPEATIVVITDGYPDLSSAAYSRHLRNQGNKIVTVLVTDRSDQSTVQYSLKKFGSDMACLFDPSEPESIAAVSHLFAQLDA
jgi:hypothetical protein